MAVSYKKRQEAKLKLMVINNPNKDKSVKSTDVLNYYSNLIRGEKFYENISNEGFELSFADFKWEWIINFKSTTGFIVLKEIGKETLKMWVYSHTDDLRPTEFVINNASEDVKCFNKLLTLLEANYINIKR
jgi:hypothetical protein